MILTPKKPMKEVERFGNILDDILKFKKEEISAFKKSLGLPLPIALPSKISFREALEKPGPRFIFEYKKASPSKGAIRPNADLGKIAKIYDRKGDAISVLTDNAFFGGSFDDLANMRSKTNKPLLCKDFFIDEIQIARARLKGADAILLMLSVLSDESYKILEAKASSYKMDVLTEVHNKDEMIRAIKLNARIIGINNRNLKDLTINLDTTRKLSRMTPKDCIVVSESGYLTRSDIRQNASSSDAFLIGSAVMSNADPETKINELIMDQVKVCGLTQIKDANLAADLGARYGGLIFTDLSPRCVTMDEAQDITKEQRLDYVGVFLDAPLEEVSKVAHQLKLSAVQLHGNESDEYRQILRTKLPKDCKIIQALKIAKSLPKIMPKYSDYYLFDTYSTKAQGGTGKSFNWNILNDFKELDRVFLAGGLSVENLGFGLSKGVFALDVNSNLESLPGVKCPDKMKAFFKALKSNTQSRNSLELAS